MARQSIGSFTVTELADGTSPVAAFLSNESHTFAAAYDGSVSGNEFETFTTTLNVFLGDVAIPYVQAADDAAMANGTFRLADNSLNSSNGLETNGSGFPPASSYVVTAQTSPGVSARIDATKVSLTHLSANSGNLVINIRVKTNNGTIRPFFLVVGYNKQIDGSDGDSVQLGPTKQFFLADGSGTFDPSVQTDSIVNIFTQGLTGNLQYFIGQNGGTFNKVTSTSDVEGGISGFDVGRSGTLQTSMYSTDIDITDASSLTAGDTVTLTVILGGISTDYNIILASPFSIASITSEWANAISIPPGITLTNETSTGFTLTSNLPIIASSSANIRVSVVGGTTPSAIPVNAQRLFISTANIGSNDSITLKVTGASESQGTASVSFTKVRRGFTGEASINVIIESTDGDTFIDGTAGTKTLTAVIYDQGTGLLLTDSNINYHWHYEHANGGTVNINTVGNINTVVPTGDNANGAGSSFASITIDDTDINELRKRTTFVCVVTNVD